MDHKRPTFIFILLLCFCSIPLISQDFAEPTGDRRLAKEYYDYGNFKLALEEYRILQGRKPNNINLNYKLGVCYLNSNKDKSKSIKYLEFVAQQDKYDVDVLFNLAKAYHINYRFDDAIKTFEKYNKENKYKDSLVVARYIECCLNGKELVKYPLDVRFDNLGKRINTEYPEFLPFVSDQESEVYFTTKRRGTVGGMIDYDGNYLSDLFMAKAKVNNGWSRSKPLSPLMNTDLPEELVGLSRNGMYLIYNTDNFGVKDLSMSIKPRENSRSFPRPNTLSSVNANSNEHAATITDGGDFLIFASNREGGYGGLDLYMSRVLPDGKWGIPINLGPEVNTKYNDNFPNISGDGKTLYFASEGHTSMGGYDIFKTTFDEWTNRWKKPKNFGYPINTTMDDYNICFTKSGRNAYVSQLRPGGWGDLDIYRVTFFKKEPEFTVLRGKIVSDSTLAIVADSLRKDIRRLETKIVNLEKKSPKSSAIRDLKENLIETKQRVNIYNPVTLNSIRIINSNDGTVFGRYKPNEKTGKYVIILPPGVYDLEIRNEGFEDYNEKLRIQDKVYFKPEIVRDIYLMPKPGHLPSDL